MYFLIIRLLKDVNISVAFFNVSHGNMKLSLETNVSMSWDCLLVESMKGFVPLVSLLLGIIFVYRLMIFTMLMHAKSLQPNFLDLRK